MSATRLQGWEARLATVLEAARHQPYALGEHDCLRLACQSVEALTGVDHWPRFAGYTTQREALRTIARIAATLGEAVTAVLRVEPSRIRMAQRGDIALYRDVTGQDHLGVVVGSNVAVLREDGIQMLPLLDNGLLCAWRVG